MISLATEIIVDLVRRHGARGVARAIGVDHKTVTKLVAGSSPRPALRAKLLEVYGVSIEAWETVVDKTADRATKPTAAAKPSPKKAPTPAVEKGEAAAKSSPSEHNAPSGASEPAGPIDSRAELEDHVRGLRRELTRLNGDPYATARERAQIGSAATGAMRLLAKLDGTGELTESQILRSDHWVKLRNAVFDALAAHPEALADVNAALRKLVD